MESEWDVNDVRGPEKASRWRRIYRHCHKSITTASVNGLRRVVAARNASARVFWLLVICGALAMFTFHLYTLVCRYRERPTATVVRPNHINFEPPDIYVCPQHPVSQSRLLFYESPERDKLRQVENDVTRLWQRVYNATTRKFLTPLNYIKDTVDFVLLSQVAGHNAEQLFLAATLNVIQITPEPFFSRLYVNCFVFRPDAALFSSTVDVLDLALFSDNYQPICKGNESSLLYNAYATGGVRITVVARGHYPTASSPSVILSPGTVNNIWLSFKKTLNQPSKGNCVDNQLTPILEPYSLRKQFFSATSEYCFYSAMIGECIQQCGCLISTDHIPYKFAKYPLCQNASFLTQFNISHVWSIVNCVSNCTRFWHKIMEINRNKCVRYRHCVEHTYDLRHSGSRIPERAYTMINTLIAKKYQISEKRNRSIYAYNFIKNDNDMFRKGVISENFILVSITPAELLSTYIEEEFTYPLASLFSDIGGILGLYLAFSLLTLLECIELVSAILKIATKSKVTVERRGAMRLRVVPNK